LFHVSTAISSYWAGRGFRCEHVNCKDNDTERASSAVPGGRDFAEPGLPGSSRPCRRLLDVRVRTQPRVRTAVAIWHKCHMAGSAQPKAASMWSRATRGDVAAICRILMIDAPEVRRRSGLHHPTTDVIVFCCAGYQGAARRARISPLCPGASRKWKLAAPDHRRLAQRTGAGTVRLNPFQDERTTGRLPQTESSDADRLQGR
jgi:hypothetical protein